MTAGCCAGVGTSNSAVAATASAAVAADAVPARAAHTADAQVQRFGCGALRNMAAGSDARKQAVVDAGGAVTVALSRYEHMVSDFGGWLAALLDDLAVRTTTTTLW